MMASARPQTDRLTRSRLGLPDPKRDGELLESYKELVRPLPNSVFDFSGALGDPEPASHPKALATLIHRVSVREIPARPAPPRHATLVTYTPDDPISARRAAPALARSITRPLARSDEDVAGWAAVESAITSRLLAPDGPAGSGLAASQAAGPVSPLPLPHWSGADAAGPVGPADTSNGYRGSASASSASPSASSTAAAAAATDCVTAPSEGSPFDQAPLRFSPASASQELTGAGGLAVGARVERYFRHCQARPRTAAPAGYGPYGSGPRRSLPGGGIHGAGAAFDAGDALVLRPGLRATCAGRPMSAATPRPTPDAVSDTTASTAAGPTPVFASLPAADAVGASAPAAWGRVPRPGGAGGWVARRPRTALGVERSGYPAAAPFAPPASATPAYPPPAPACGPAATLVPVPVVLLRVPPARVSTLRPASAPAPAPASALLPGGWEKVHVTAPHAHGDERRDRCVPAEAVAAAQRRRPPAVFAAGYLRSTHAELLRRRAALLRRPAPPANLAGSFQPGPGPAHPHCFAAVSTLGAAARPNLTLAVAAAAEATTAASAGAAASSAVAAEAAARASASPRATRPARASVPSPVVAAAATGAAAWAGAGRGTVRTPMLGVAASPSPALALALARTDFRLRGFPAAVIDPRVLAAPSAATASPDAALRHPVRNSLLVGVERPAAAVVFDGCPGKAPPAIAHAPPMQLGGPIGAPLPATFPHSSAQLADSSALREGEEGSGLLGGGGAFRHLPVSTRPRTARLERLRAQLRDRPAKAWD